MNSLPKLLLPIILPFASLFSKKVWPSATVLLIGAILSPGKRTVSAILRVMGLSDEPHFQTYHRVLSRARWSSLKASRCLFNQLIATFCPDGPLVLAIDDTIERRWGKKIAARGIYRDPVRSSDNHFVKTSGLRWLSLMVLSEIPFAQSVWALPFLTVLAPSERYYDAKGSAHKPLTLWAQQMLKQVRRWLPHREIVVTADSSFAVIDLLDVLRTLSSPIYMVTRLRLDARLYDPAPPRKEGQMGRPRIVGKRLPSLSSYLDDSTTPWKDVILQGWYGNRDYALQYLSGTALWYHTGKTPVPIRWVLVKDPQGKLEPQAFLCTDPSQSPEQILLWFRLRWKIEVTFEESRAHLGLETQRQWSDLAILRTTPALLGLFSIIVLFAHQLQSTKTYTTMKTAWYPKELPTFSDAIAWVRQDIWHTRLFDMSRGNDDLQKVPHSMLDSWLSLLCYAA